MNYADLLSRAREKMPKQVFDRDRFEIPKIRGHMQGSKTVLSNFVQIANQLRREPEHMLKFVLRELASPGERKGPNVAIGAKISASRVNEKIRQYANEFVLCPQCGKPDTDLLKEGEYTIMKCSACGSRTHVKSKI